ncbi:MAG: phenylalanine 4-monooxygenase [Oligoflexia bacterium]|nr:MAG: phenylalanine 4-monooxygenase [Oligoflexia bacterium]
MSQTFDQIPNHLRKYVVEQNYEKYTSIDQACWRFVLRQLKDFLSKNAHESYLDGLEKTGISIEKIPHISDISKKIEKFGWRAIPVSGFIPPAAFMEMQSLSILPIASDMRQLGHLMYTPAPDIVHEAAGHAPILVHPEFAAYLKQYAQVAKKAIISKEDLDVYEAIRVLSDMKENPESTEAEIEAAQKHLEQVTKNTTHLSEAAELARMNWWTAEYGLIGDEKNPKIYGAGLLSSVGESRWCLSDKVKKIPMSLDCLKYSYDITEPQPQLFVTPNFQKLGEILEEMASGMAYRTGGIQGLKKALQAQSVNTAEFNTGIQISGVLTKYICDEKNQVAYLQFSGPSQLSYQDHELKGHDRRYHQAGYGTAVGPWKNKVDLTVGKNLTLEYTSGVKVQGDLVSALYQDEKLILLSFQNCVVTYKNQTLFDPAWGTYDLAVGEKVISVFGGPADRVAYGEVEDFPAKRVPKRTFSEKELLQQKIYLEIRELREKKISGIELEKKLTDLLDVQGKNFPEDWLFVLEAYELSLNRSENLKLQYQLKSDLIKFAEAQPENKSIIEDGLRLAKEI